MKNFIAIVDKVDAENALKIGAFLIFVFKMVEMALILAVPISRSGFGFLTSAWGFGIISNFVFQFCAALFQPLVLLALARIITLKKSALTLQTGKQP